MIRALLALVLFAPAFAFAGQCDKSINDTIAAEMEAKGWKNFGASEVDALRVTEIVYQESNELDQGEIDSIMGYVAKGGFEFFQVTGTADMSAGFQELLIVDPKGCSIVDRELTYAE